MNVRKVARGDVTLPGIAFYPGSEFALTGISESLAAVRALGVKRTAVAPGGLRTDCGRPLEACALHRRLP